MKKILTLIPAVLAGFCFLSAQNLNNVAGGQIHGNFEIDAQYYNADSLIGAPAVPEKALMNGWGNVNYTNGNFSAGLRYESYLNPLQGYDPQYKGSGIPYRYATYNNDGLEITVGNSYEQFGSGLVLRAWQDPGLGYDNSIDGMRVRYTPYKGIYLKGIWGRQRNYFSLGQGIVRGFDGEVNLNELFDSCMANKKTQVILGGSFVSKYQNGSSVIYQTSSLTVPQNVGAWSSRMNIIRDIFKGQMNLLAEYAYKINDPSTSNRYVYKPGNASYISLAYSQKGLGISLAGTRVDNFSFRSDRAATGKSLMINYLPALTKQNTYTLAAYYPYATQPNGQIGWQGEVAYKIKKQKRTDEQKAGDKFGFGGKFGIDVTLNYSAEFMLDTTGLNDAAGRNMGYTSKIPGISDSLFYQEINLEIFHRFYRHMPNGAVVRRKNESVLQGTIMYSYVQYNKNVIEGEAGYPIVHAHVIIADAIMKLNSKLTLRSDFEHMYVMPTKGVVTDKGNWVMALEELTIGAHYFAAVMDQYNYGNAVPDLRVHYFNVQFGLMKGTNRIVVGYGKQRSGIFCVGGVCRFVPASNGFSLTITSSF